MNMIIRGLWENIGSIYLVWGRQLGGFSWRSDIFSDRSESVGMYRQSGWRPAFQAERCAKALRQESESEVVQSCPTLCDTMDSAYQASPSMGFSRQEYWSGLPFPSPGDPPNPGIEPGSPALEADALTSEPPGKAGRDVAYLKVWRKARVTRLLPPKCGVGTLPSFPH